MYVVEQVKNNTGTETEHYIRLKYVLICLLFHSFTQLLILRAGLEFLQGVDATRMSHTDKIA